MKYRLTEDWLEYKKGYEFHDFERMPDYESIIRSLLLKTGILEEVKEEEWFPRRDWLYWYVTNTGTVYSCIYYHDVDDVGRLEYGNVFRSETDAKEASEKIKALLLSLKK